MVELYRQQVTVPINFCQIKGADLTELTHKNIWAFSYFCICTSLYQDFLQFPHAVIALYLGRWVRSPKYPTFPLLFRA